MSHRAPELVREGRKGEAILVHTFDLDFIRDYREAWGVYRDRRPDRYGTIATHDGRTTTL